MLSSLKEEHAALLALGANVVGISADTVASHAAFCEGLGGCPFPLASDPALEAMKAYEALGEDGKRGKRAIYVLDEHGIVIHKIPWYQPGNAGQFMEIFRALGLE